MTIQLNGKPVAGFPVDVLELLELIKEGGYDFYGLRVVETGVEPGDILENSWEIIDDVPQYELPGTSVIAIDESKSGVRTAIAQIRIYYGRYLLLVGSNEIAGSGQDDYEDYLEAPEVLAVWPATWWGGSS